MPQKEQKSAGTGTSTQASFEPAGRITSRVRDSFSNSNSPASMIIACTKDLLSPERLTGALRVTVMVSLFAA